MKITELIQGDIFDNTPIISVAMPVYNGAKYLSESIESILNQTFKNFELIIIDDGSTDNSLEILKKYRDTDSRIRLVTRENRNLSTTLNDIIDLARGQWLARMDQDDISLPQRFKRQLEWLDVTGADICGSWVQLFGGDENRILKHPQSDKAIKIEMLFSSPFAHPTVMMKTKLVKKLRYDKAWEKCEDYDLWERAVHADWKMTNIQENLLCYRQHPTQLTSNSLNDNFLLSQMIRERYWIYFSRDLSVEKSWINDVSNIREKYPFKSNSENIDSAFFQVLKHCEDESRSVAFLHITNLFYLLAGNNLDAAKRWSYLNNHFNMRFPFHIKAKLYLLSLMRIRPNSFIYNKLKKLYFSFFST